MTLPISMTTSVSSDKDGHDAEHEHEISRGKSHVGKGIDIERERSGSFPPTVFPQNHKQEHSHSHSPSRPVPHTTTPTYSEGEGTMTTGSTAQTVEIAELDDYDVGPDVKDGDRAGGGKMGRKQHGFEGGEVRIVREDEGQEEETEEENMGMGVFGALDPTQLQRHAEHRSTSYNPLDLGYGYNNAHSRTISNTTVHPHPTINTHAHPNPTRTETPPLTTSNLNLHQLPAQTNPEFTIKRFGLERTASWATASASVGRTGLNSSGSADSGVASSKEHQEKEARNLVRPGYKRSRTAFSGTTSRLTAVGTINGSGKNTSGLNTKPAGLQRSRSFSSSAAVYPVNGTSPTTTTAMFHPYRLALPQSKKSRTQEQEVYLTSPLFTMDNNAGYFERPCSPISASAVAGGSKYRTRPGLTRTLSSKTDSEARSNASSTLTSGPGIGNQHRSYQSSLLRPRPKLWRGFSQPARHRPAPGSDVPPSPGSSSLREGSAGSVDEYMIDMDKWILGTGEASASQRSPSPSPSPEPELCMEGQGVKDVAAGDRASQDDQEDLWVDGCRIQCADGTECLTTSEAYVLNVQLLHQTYSTSMYVSKEYNLHIAGEKTHMEEYDRVIEYPKTADMGKLKATLVDGLVSVYVPRLPEAPPAPA
ncbi:hypothetical protein HD553DRAFT_153836 [Filobasidium floriforme]|uniref:uncharacterized protein n=1 Tax=Filobasidium floriforme TaxID=5210 RepID=UPI001E8CCCA1|nr:uncharacterized protein HD553DRAFT_153836 [Filobasidium floriforme]KAH8089051.1 hypothetical protein HD553DRAFT_153836 [Filobasidium floriforme]